MRNFIEGGDCMDKSALQKIAQRFGTTAEKFKKEAESKGITPMHLSVLLLSKEFKGKKQKKVMDTDFELRIDGKENKKIVGYAAVFNDEAPETNGFIEKIAPGAFANALRKQNADVKALINHEAYPVLGRYKKIRSDGKENTLELREDEKGLYYEIDPPDTQAARDLMELMRRGDIDQSSFGFVVAVEEWEESGDVPVRTIVEVDELFDVSPVTFPWYKNTESGIKSRQKIFEEYKAKSKEIETDNTGKLEILKKRLKLRERND